MNVTIEFMRLASSASEIVEVSIGDYFDLDEGEMVSTTSVPKYGDAYKYIAVPVSLLKWTVLRISEGQEFWNVRTQFLAGEKCMMIHSASSDGSEELINQTELDDGIVHTVRNLRVSDGNWFTVSDVTNRTPVDDEDGVQNNVSNWTFEELKHFGFVGVRSLGK